MKTFQKASVSFLMSVFLLSGFWFYQSKCAAQVFSSRDKKALEDPIEKYRLELLKMAFSDNRFAGGYLLYLNFYHDFDVVAMENINSRKYRPKVSQRLLNYYLDGLDEINDAIASEYFDRGQGRIDSSKFAEAMVDFDNVLLYTPKNSDAYVSRGVLFIFSHQYEEALAELSKAQKFNSQNAQVPFNRAVIFLDQGKLKEAELAVDSSIKIDPTYARAYFEKGLILHAMGNPAEAIKVLRRARSLNDPDAENVIRDIKQSQKKQPKPLNGGGSS